MDIRTMQFDLIKKLTEVRDAGVLQQIAMVLNSMEKPDDYWGYDADGKLITDEMMLHIIQKADEDEKEGRLISQDDLEKEAENW